MQLNLKEMTIENIFKRERSFYGYVRYHWSQTLSFREYPVHYLLFRYNDVLILSFGAYPNQNVAFIVFLKVNGLKEAHKSGAFE